jgi:hypothetical protein
VSCVGPGRRAEVHLGRILTEPSFWPTAATATGRVFWWIIVRALALM